ncbi:hypothetical protein ACHAW5_008037 [Stephanodiscus triporus]|uniref:RNA helicase n=1 Tax=Stephanodiscus triporus TaxID=2934178 RepID=A0ABD3N778_9STRA
MATLLALSVLCILPNSHHSLAWTATSTAKTRRRNHSLRRSSFLSSVPTDEALEGVESLQHEIKDILRSNGHKVTGNKTELIQRLLIQQQSSSDDTTKCHVDGIIASDKIALDPSLNHLPEPLVEALIRFTSSSISTGESSHSSTPKSPKLLPIQQKSYEVISKGGDAVLFSPTGTGKSLGFILPLAARLLSWKRDGSLLHKKQAQKQRFMRQNRGNGNDSLSSQTVDAASPSILVIEPSRELARQVGKVWERFHPTAAKGSKSHVVTVYGGVPMTRHAALLGSKTDVVIGTPGRIRELIRENYLSTKHLRSIVLDEADTLLNFGDNPEVEWLLDGMVNDYQLVLASATVNKRVEKFVGEIMELEVGGEGYVVVGRGDASDNGGIIFDDEIAMDGAQGIDANLNDDIEIHAESRGEFDSEKNCSDQHKTPTVRHWSMPASPTSRITLTSDLIITMTPRRGIVFVPTKAEVESVAQELTERSAKDVSVHILHGDMVQQARSRTINAFREDSASITRILIATDVAARGLDLPAVDLVVQYGVPRKTGKDGTFDSELYIHRTGRAGRFGNTRTADAILLYDRTQGETATLNKLVDEMKHLHNIVIAPRQLPSPSEVMDASYDRVMRLCDGFGTGSQSLVHYFAEKLSGDLVQSNGECSESGPSDNELFLVHRLATAMASLSGLDDVVTARSLLTADPGDRTVRVWNESCDSSNPLPPSEVTKLVKSLGSGKLGRISTCNDGSVVFDLGAKKADLLLSSTANDTKLSGWHFEMPSSLPTLAVDK